MSRRLPSSSCIIFSNHSSKFSHIIWLYFLFTFKLTVAENSSILLLSSSNSSDVQQITVVNICRTWPEAIIYYRMSDYSKTDSQDFRFNKKVVLAAIDEFHRLTCIQFVRHDPLNKTRFPHYVDIVIKEGSKCGVTSIGFNNSKTELYLGDRCSTFSGVLSLFMQILGFYSEQLRPNRDDYLRIRYENLLPGYENYLKKKRAHYINVTDDVYNQPYDYFSITHDDFAYGTKNFLPTLDAIYESGRTMGRGPGFSFRDLQKLRAVYHCSNNISYTDATIIKAKPFGNRTASTALLSMPLTIRAFLLMLKIVELMNSSSEMQVHFFARLWTHREVPYVVLTSPNDDEYRRNLAETVNEAFRKFNKISCVPFVKRDEKTHPQRDYVVLTFTNSCQSSYGRTGGPQKFSIGFDCGTLRHVVQNLMKTVGIFREILRTDRDNYIKIRFENIEEKYQYKFKGKYDPVYIDNNGDLIDFDALKEDYDYHSITHFVKNEFGINESITIESKNSSIKEFGSTNAELSDYDLKKLRQLYNCSDKESPTSTVFEDPFPQIDEPISRRALVVISAFGLGFILLFALYTTWRYKSSERIRLLTAEILLTSMQSKSQLELSQQNVPQIDAKLIKLRENIGKGHFGQVYRAIRKPLMQEIAVKMVSTENFEIAVKEAQLHYNLNHENVVIIYGIAQKGRDTMILLELMHLGSLQGYLNYNRPKESSNYYCTSLTELDLLRISYQIASGLAYLASQSIVHRDIAARNCLVTQKIDVVDPNKPFVVVKISDFGMSRRLYAKAYYSPRDETIEIPKVIAPECLDTHKFTHESDIWSFGMTIWEVFSFGKEPFKGLPPSTIFRMIKAGERPKKPTDWSSCVCDFIDKCWMQEPNMRIKAGSAAELLVDLIEESSNNLCDGNRSNFEESQEKNGDNPRNHKFSINK